jgi:hypothetical protein
LNWGVDDLVERMGGDVVTDAKESLQNQFRTEYAAKLAAKDKELTSVVASMANQNAFEQQKEFLKAKAPFDPHTFVTMFLFGFKDYSRDQALEIKPLLAEYKKHLSGTWVRIGELQVGQVEANVERIVNPSAGAPTPRPAQIAKADGSSPHPFNPSLQTGRPAGRKSLEETRSFAMRVQRLAEMDRSLTPQQMFKIAVEAYWQNPGAITNEPPYNRGIPPDRFNATNGMPGGKTP